MTLAWILGSCLLGGVLSVAAAGAVALRASPTRVPMLISYAVGALLGAVFLEILPHAFLEASAPKYLGATVLAGILVFFVLEKLVLWRHQHGPPWGEPSRRPHGANGHQESDHGRSGMMIMIGDTFHNFVDGVLIAAAFMADLQLGLVTALAIIAHEIPQEIGDFVILLYSGYSRRQAMMINLLSSLATLVGGLLGYAALSEVEALIPALLGFVAASMIYVAVADLIPGLHRRPELRATTQQVLLIVLGIASIYGVRLATGHSH
jgi:zinc and cadmium transporter